MGITDFSPPDTETFWRLFFSLRPQPKALAIAVAANGHSIVRERLDNTSKLSPMPSSYLRIHALLGSLTAAVKRGDIVVGTVMIRCPKTGRAISTGIRADVATFHATPVFFSQVLCPLCQLTHEWFAKDAWICDMPSE